MNVQRSQRLASLLRDEINGHLRRGVKDPRLASVSVTRVEVSGDCRNARVLFTCLGDQSGAADARKAFERAGGYLRSQLGRQLRIRQIPELSFRHDKVLHEATEVRMLIDRVVAEDVVVQRDRGEGESETETESESETETETETETESASETESETESESETETETETESASESESASETETETESGGR